MKNRACSGTALWIAILSVCFGFLGCKKEGPDPIDPPTTSTMEILSGTVVIPPNSALLDDTLMVFAPLHSLPLNTQSPEFSALVPAHSPYNFLFVGNGSGSVNMIGYFSSDGNGHTLDVTTTALGLVLAAPWAINLHPQARDEVVQEVLNDPNFPALRSEVEQLVIAGQDLLDTNHLQLRNALFGVSQSVVGKVGRTSSGNFTMTASNSNLRFENTYSCAYVVEIYKDGSFHNRFTVGGSQMLSLSLGDLINNNFYAQASDPVTVPLTADGQYDIVARNGWDEFGNLSQSNGLTANEAWKKNLLTIAKDAFGIIWPGFGSFVNDQCLSAGFDVIEDHITTIFPSDPPSNMQEALGYVTDVVWMVVESSHDLFLNCSSVSNQGGASMFLERAAKLLGFLEKLENIGNGASAGLDWMLAPPVYYFCKVKENGQLRECQFRFSTHSYALTSVNSCSVPGVGTGSRTDHAFSFEKPSGVLIDHIQVSWVMQGCSQGSPGGGDVLDYSWLGPRDKESIFNMCFVYGDCGSARVEMRLVAKDGRMSQPATFTLPKPPGGNRDGSGAAGMLLEGEQSR